MASVADLVEESSLARLANGSTLAAGKRLAEEDKVELVDFGPLKVIARVMDGEGYEVRLISSVGGLIQNCTCQEKGFCRHCVATALVTWEQAPARKAGGF